MSSERAPLLFFSRVRFEVSRTPSSDSPPADGVKNILGLRYLLTLRGIPYSAKGSIRSERKRPRAGYLPNRDEEIRAAGYDASHTQVKEYVRRIRPAPVPEPVVRFETPPGKQAQVDFAHLRVPWGRRYALLVVLGYSRLLWVRFLARQDASSLTNGLEQAFSFFGGVPAECLFDQMKAVVVDDNRDRGGPLIENLEFIRFANQWGFKARA